MRVLQILNDPEADADEWVFEPPHDKTNKVASIQSDRSLRCPHEETLGP